MTQELGDAVTLDLRGYYLDRREWQTVGALRGTQFVGPAFFFGTPTGIPDFPFRLEHLTSGNPVEFHQVHFAFGDGETASIANSLESWGATATLTADLGAGWQLRALANVGWSRSESHTGQYDTAVLANAVSAGLFNPYDPAASDPRGLAAVQDHELFGLTRQNLTNARVVADGTLLRLPGGAVKLALGGEFLRESIWTRTGLTVRGAEATGSASLLLPANLPGSPLALIREATNPLPVVQLSRNIASAFGELVIPVIGKDNARPGLKELTLSASARYDRYSDVGDTFNPKFGASYRPFEWLRLRGAWGKSFVAPSLVDLDEAVQTQLGFATNFAILFPTAELIANGVWPPPAPGQTTIAILSGSQPGLLPQTATSLSFGIDIDPPFVPGLNFGLTYWKTDFNRGIGTPPVLQPGLFWSRFQSSITANPTQAQFNAAVAIADRLGGSPCAPLPGCLYAIVDARRRNLLKWQLDGLDLTARYERPTGFGSIGFDVNAGFSLHHKVRPTSDVPDIDFVAANISRFRLRATWLRGSARCARSRASAIPPATGSILPSASRHSRPASARSMSSTCSSNTISGTRARSGTCRSASISTTSSIATHLNSGKPISIRRSAAMPTDRRSAGW